MTEIKKLEIKHLCSYLPYGLKVQAKGISDTHICTVVEVGIEFGLYIRAKQKDNKHWCCSNYWEMKPILRPMSDIYKEINGEVGIVELAKIALDIPNLEVWFDNEVGKVYLNFKGETHEFGLLAKSKDFFSSYPHISNSLKCYEYLFANHYDVFGLIEQGLAINKNDIE